jgi:hypothetical protein
LLRFISGFCWVPGWCGTSSDQSGDKGTGQGFAPMARVVNELEEAEVERQLMLGDAAVRAQPGAQQRPEALNGVDVDLAEAVTILVARVLGMGVADCLVPVAPGRQAGVDVVLVSMYEGAGRDSGGTLVRRQLRQPTRATEPAR